MKKTFRIIAVFALFAVISLPTLRAGNDERRGTPGASELLINPWARSSGWGNVNVANARGLDAFFINIAGLTSVQTTEIGYTNTFYAGGKSGLSSAASINAFGLAQRVFDKGVLGFYVMTMNFGDIDVTTNDSPDAGTNGTFSPSFMNLNISYAHAFTASIRGGFNLKIVSETTADVTGSGFAFDAGIQYVTGEDDELKFGITLRNIGFGFNFSGTGLSIPIMDGNGNFQTLEHPSTEMEFPTNFNIGASYDFLFDKWNQRFTVAGNFTSNAFSKDLFAVGAEYSLLDQFQLRCAYVYQTAVFDKENRTTFNTGLTAGASFIVPLSKKEGDNSNLSIDYSYRNAAPFKGTHSIGATVRF